MTREPSPYHHGDLRHQLVELASNALAEGGTEAISLRKICNRLGVSHTAAYAHFTTKQALIAAVLTHCYDDLSRRLENKIDPGAPLKDQLIEAALVYHSFCRERPAHFLAMTGPRLNIESDHPSLETALERAYAFIERPITTNTQEGALGKATAPAFWSGLQGFLAQIILGRLRIRPEEEAKLVKEFANSLYVGLGLAK